MKIVLIAGAWCVGKTSTVRSIIARYGVKYACPNYMILNNDYCIVGDYSSNTTNVGCDRLRSTTLIVDIVRNLPTCVKVVILESVYLVTTGINVINILFHEKFSSHLIAYLYAPFGITKKRLMLRSGTAMTQHYPKEIIKMQNTLKRYKQMGIPIISIDTSKFSKDDVADMILNKILTL